MFSDVICEVDPAATERIDASNTRKYANAREMDHSRDGGERAAQAAVNHDGQGMPLTESGEFPVAVATTSISSDAQVIEHVLIKALEGAVQARRWELVMIFAQDLQQRQSARQSTR